MSVKIVDYKQRESLDGKSFYALVLQGGVEIITSQTGKQYMSAKKTSIPSTFDEETCKAIVGTELPGTIEKVDCEPYEYVTSNGELVTLNFRYEYQKAAIPSVEITNLSQQLQYGDLMAA